jgi:hypothetical protein
MTYNRNKPADGAKTVSADVRSNFQAIDQSLFGINLIANSDFLIWHNGDANPPALWGKSGSPTIARTGTGLADTTRKKGDFATKMTYSGSGTDSLDYNILTTASYDDGLDGVPIVVAVWVKSDSTNAKIALNDGGTGSPTRTDAHDGDDDWQLMTLTHTIAANADKLILQAELAATGDMYVSQPTVLIGAVPPADTIPAIPRRETFNYQFGSGITTGAKLLHRIWDAARVEDVGLFTDANPNTDINLDVFKWDGSSWVDMYATGPTLSTSDNAARKIPDATSYARRCLAPSSGSGVDNGLLRIDVSQAATGPVFGEIQVRVLSYVRPLSALILPDE